MRQCRVCGGTLVGDGYMMARHCENVDLPADRECDAPVLECDAQSLLDADPEFAEWLEGINLLSEWTEEEYDAWCRDDPDPAEMSSLVGTLEACDEDSDAIRMKYDG